LSPDTSEAQAEEALWQELRNLMDGDMSDYELEKVKNKFEANTLMGEINVMNKALNLGFYAMTGDLDLINRESKIYRSLSREEVADFARCIFCANNSSTLIYRAK
jgi:predicted Zn-dependent peptidase